MTVGGWGWAGPLIVTQSTHSLTHPLNQVVTVGHCYAVTTHTDSDPKRQHNNDDDDDNDDDNDDDDDDDDNDDKNDDDGSDVT